MFVTSSANIVIRHIDFGFPDFDCFSAIEALNFHFAALSFFTASRALPIRAVWILYLFAFSATVTNYHRLILIDLHEYSKLCKDIRLKARMLWNALHLHPNPKRIMDGVLG